MRLKKYWCIAVFMIVLLAFTGCDKAEGTGKTTGASDTSGQAADGGQDRASPAGTAVSDTEGEVIIPEDGIAFSKSNSFYAETIELEILSDKPCSIYYTTDGSDPDTKKQLYRKAIRLQAGSMVKATCVKAKAYFEDSTESDTITHTYFVGRDVASRYDTLVFSVTTDPYNLYDYEYGIFVEGKLRDDYVAANPGIEINPNDPANFNMRGRDSEREVYLEVLEPDGTKVISQAAGIRTYGGWSRAKAQKSIKIFARKEYDEDNNKLRYEFFPFKTSADGEGDLLDTFKQLVLRNCGNDNGFGFIRDELFQMLAGQAGYSDYEAVRPAAMYVNGDYRGFFWLHEVYCDEYFEDHYGNYDGSFMILEGGETYKGLDASGENEAAVEEYDQMYYTYSYMDLTEEANYRRLCELIDVENYLEYFALQVYIGNEDWPHNNYRAVRYYAAEGEEYREAPFDGKWRYLLHDLDFSFGIYGTPATTNFLAKYMGQNGQIMEACPLFGQLMKREDCREIFIRKTLDLLNGAFSPDNLNRVLDEMNAARLNELKNTYNKGLLDDWVTYEQLGHRIEDIKSYGATRASFILNSYLMTFKLDEVYQLEAQPAQGCKLKINTFITDKAFKGRYYTDYGTTISALLPEGKSVDYWLVNGEKVASEELVITKAMVKASRVEVSCVIK
jgi:hypothetical protein